MSSASDFFLIFPDQHHLHTHTISKYYTQTSAAIVQMDLDGRTASWTASHTCSVDMRDRDPSMGEGVHWLAAPLAAQLHPLEAAPA